MVQREPKPRGRPNVRGGGGAATRRVRVSNASASQFDESDEPAAVAAPNGQYAAGTSHYSRQILDYFVNDSQQVPEFLNAPPADFDPNVVIDEDGHTALHWAAAMSRIRVVKLLIQAGADLFRANAQGQTALMRSVQFTNSYDLRRFHGACAGYFRV